MTYRTLLAATLALTLWAGVAVADPCRFIVMGDCQPWESDTDTVTPSRGCQRAVKEANLLEPEFVVILGDCLRGYTDLAVVEQQWEAFDALLSQFEMPVYRVVGNHDVFSKETEQLYQRRHGPLWRSFEMKGCHFIVLDSEDQSAPQRIAGAQLAWLRSDLAAAKDKRIFIFVHEPLWGMVERDFGRSEWGRTVHPLLAAAKVDTVFAGHVHRYTMQPARDGVRYIITGGGGGKQVDSALAGGFLHYLLVAAADQGKAKLAVIRTGNVEPETIVTGQQAERVLQFERQFRLAPILVEGRPMTHRVSWRLTNPFAESISGSVRFDEVTGWTARPRSCEIDLPGNGTAVLDFDLRVDPAMAESPLTCNVDYHVAGCGSATVTAAVPFIRTAVAPLMRSISLDGSLDEWSCEPCLRLDRARQAQGSGEMWKGPDHFSALAWVGRDRRYLYLAVKVKDGSVSPTPADATSPAGDSVVLYLDGRAGRMLGQRDYGPGVGFMIFTPGAGELPPRALSPSDKSRRYEGARVASQLTAEGYTMEIAVPLTSFPRRGDLMGLDLAVKDTSNPQGGITLFWHGDAANWRDASRFGRVRTK